MVNELNLSPTGYVILLLVLAILFYLIATTEVKTEPTEDVTKMQMQGRD